MVARYKKNDVKLNDEKKVDVYATPKISHALDLIDQMSLFEGVKLMQLLEVMYEQGKKDGARNAFSAIHAGVAAAEKSIPHRNPGRKPKAKR